MKSFKTWSHISNLLADGKSCDLLIVASHTGSSPGKTGFQMVIQKDGKHFGTIGGGIMELNFIEKAKERLIQNHGKPEILQQVHSSKAPENVRSGLICSGSQHIIMISLGPQHQNLAEDILNHYENQNPQYLAVNAGGIEILNKHDETGLFNASSEDWEYVQEIAHPETVYIVGAGHVGTAISRTLKNLDFYVVMVDNRPELKMLIENDWVHKKYVGPYDEIYSEIKEDENSYVVVVTYGLNTDLEVLTQIIRNDYKYLGVMGSKAKLNKLFKTLRSNGVEDSYIRRLHAPIGLPIANGSAEEIAISITSELLKVKNQREL